MTKIAYFDCFSGASGDMIIGALLDAGIDFELFKQEMAKLNFPEFELKTAKVSKKHLAAIKFDVIDAGKKVYRHPKDLNAIVDKSSLDEDIKQKAKNIFLKIAEAEAKIHNLPVEKVHYHEIGAVDTVVDVVGALVGLKLLGIDKVYCSRINVGSGFVEFSHGRYPVPAPATAEILKGVPVYSNDTQGELVTPTGAAIITEIADYYGSMPEMVLDKIGYGAGARDLEQPNVLRVLVGTATGGEYDTDTIAVIETNIDDMNPQLYETVMENLFRQGALDVFLQNITMKKSRPAILLSVLCQPDDLDKLAKVIFTHTTSIGVRIREERRKKLQRENKVIETEFGAVNFKIARLNGEVVNIIPEYEDCKRIADERDLSLKHIYNRLSNLDAKSH